MKPHAQDKKRNNEATGTELREARGKGEKKLRDGADISGSAKASGKDREGIF